MIKTSNDIDEGDPMHPLATNVFSKEIKRVQVIYNEIKIFEPDDPKVTGVFPNRKNIIFNQVSNSVKNIS